MYKIEPLKGRKGTVMRGELEGDILGLPNTARNRTIIVVLKGLDLDSWIDLSYLQP